MDGHVGPATDDAGAATSLIAALPALYVSERRRLRRYFQDCGFVWADCDDLLQRTFLRILALRDPPQAHAPQAYLYVVARAVAISHARWLGVRTKYQSTIELLSEQIDGRTPEREIEARQTLHRCIAISLRQSPGTQEVLRLRALGLTGPQIAACRQTSVSAVEKHVTKILSDIVSGIGEDWRPEECFAHAIDVAKNPIPYDELVDDFEQEPVTSSRPGWQMTHRVARD